MPSATSKEPEAGLCVSYRRRLDDTKKYRKIHIYSDGCIREFCGEDLVRVYADWESFLVRRGARLTAIDLALYAALAYLYQWSSRAGSFWMIMARLPATLAYELSHLFAALFLSASPSGFSLWPRRNGDTWQLGSVDWEVPILAGFFQYSSAEFKKNAKGA